MLIKLYYNIIRFYRQYYKIIYNVYNHLFFWKILGLNRCKPSLFLVAGGIMMHTFKLFLSSCFRQQKDVIQGDFHYVIQICFKRRPQLSCHWIKTCFPPTVVHEIYFSKSTDFTERHRREQNTLKVKQACAAGFHFGDDIQSFHKNKNP